MINKRGNTLYIGLKPHVSYSKIDFEVQVTMPRLKGLDASGASDVKVSGFKSDDDLSIGLSGASELNGFVHVGNLNIELSGASEVELIGSGNKLTIDGSGASELDLGDFKVESANIELSGASEVEVHAVESISADLSGSSEVKYHGNPRMKDIDTSGASEISSVN